MIVSELLTAYIDDRRKAAEKAGGVFLLTTLAKELDVSRNTLHRWTCGTSNPDLPRYFALRRLVGKTSPKALKEHDKRVKQHTRQ